MKQLSIGKIKYGGEYHRFFWDKNYNPNATISNALANCTTCAYGDCLLDGFKVVSRIVSASNWHTVSNVPVVKFNSDRVKVGDVIEWSNKCHVARVFKIENGVIYIRGSFYTGINGKSVIDGYYDTRKGLNSLEEVSDFFSSNYPYRFYHETTLETENSWVHGEPDYILQCPNFTPVEKDESKDQIEVLTNEQNVRNAPNGEIVGTAIKGFYNVLNQVTTDYTWYEVEENKWIAGVNGRVVYYPRKDDYYKLYWDMVEENKQLKKRLDEIKGIANYE